MRRAGPLAMISLAVFACGGPHLEISDVRVGIPTGPNAALYFTATGPGDRLIGAHTDVAVAVEIHKTDHQDDGTVTMRPVQGIDLTHGERLILEPGGVHLMLLGVERLELGDSVEVTLRWETAGDVTVDAVVVSPSETMGDE